MWNRHYNVVMRTPVGAKYGTMAVTVEDDGICGMLDILKKANPFAGTIDAAGECRLHGELTTLMRTIPYDATGRVTEESLHLDLQGGEETFELTGRAEPLRTADQKENRT